MKLAIAKNIYERRRILGLSQQAVSKRAGMAGNYVCLLENDMIDKVGAATLQKIARALKVSVAALLKEE